MIYWGFEPVENIQMLLFIHYKTYNKKDSVTFATEPTQLNEP